MTGIIIVLSLSGVLLVIWCWFLTVRSNITDARLDAATEHRVQLSKRLDYATEHRTQLSRRLDLQDPPA